MLYKEKYHPQVKKDLKRLDRKVVKEAFSKHIDNILRKPYSGEKLHGKLSGVFSYHFRVNKVEYRIAYFIESDKKIVYIVEIGKRESFYEILKRRLIV